MVRRLLGLNVALGLLTAGLLGYTAWQVVQPLPEPAGRTRPQTASPPAPAPAPPQASPGAYQGIASRNLFSPTRSEAPPAPVAGTQTAPPPPPPKPNLYGVVLRDEASIAYLEDPMTKRVAGYRVGDNVAGGTVQRIAADRVVLARPDGQIDVRLHDPSKPKPPAAPAGQGGDAPASRPVAGRPPLPGAAGIRPTPGPGVQPSEGANLPSGRRLPPSLLRRLPPQSGGAPTNAPAR